MKNNVDKLNQEKIELEDRIGRISADLKKPMEQNTSEQALQLENRDLLMRLLKVEQENLETLNRIIDQAKSKGNQE